jgi:hypothetical protein
MATKKTAVKKPEVQEEIKKIILEPKVIPKLNIFVSCIPNTFSINGVVWSPKTEKEVTTEMLAKGDFKDRLATALRTGILQEK